MNNLRYFSCGNSVDQDGRKVRLFRFKNLYNDQTMVEVVYFDYSVYAIKFYLKKHRDSKNKYSFSNSKEFLEKRKAKNGAKNFIQTMNTIISIALNEILQNDSKASFGFMGAHKLYDPKKRFNDVKKNKDGTYEETTRYRIYQNYARRIFNPANFEYFDSKTSSIMVLINNKNKKELTKNKVEKFIKKEIISSYTS